MSKTRRSSRRIACTVVAWVVLSAALVSCKDSTGPEDLAGTWQLQTFNGDPMPAVVYEDATVTERITSQVLTLNANGTYTVVGNYSVTETGAGTSTFSSNDAGTFSVNGSTVTFTDEDDSVATGTVSGNTLTVTAEAVVLVFLRS